LELRAANARVARPTSPFALPPKPALVTWLCGEAQPAVSDASAMNEIVEPKRRALAIGLPPPFGLVGQGIQLRHRSQKLVERVGDDLLGRTAANGTRESQLEMALVVESQRECRLGLAARGSTWPWRTLASRLTSAISDWSDDPKGFRLSFWNIRLGSFIQLFVVAVNVQSVFNFRPLRMDGRTHRREIRLLRMDGRAHRSKAGRVHARVLDDVVAEGIVRLVTGSDRWLGRLESHVVPAEVLKVAVDLTEALRPHGRTGRTLAGEKTGRKRSDRLGFVHLAGSLLTDDAATEAADRTRTGLGSARRRSGRSKHGPAEILFQTI
jgi:hypothetical protein